MRSLIIILFCLFLGTILAQAESLYINGVLADELFPYKEYLSHNLEILSHDEEGLKLYTPVKEVYLRKFLANRELVLKDVNDLAGGQIIVSGEIPLFFGGQGVAGEEIPLSTVGLLWEGLKGEPVLLYFYQSPAREKFVELADVS